MKRVLAFMMVLVLSMSLVACNTESKQQAQLESDYDSTASEVMMEMLKGAERAVDLGEQVAEAWKASIDDRYDKDFNDNVRAVLSKNQSQIALIEQNKTSVDQMMKKLKDPPARFAETHKVIVEFYGVYGQLTRLGVSPTGNYTSFVSNMNNYQDEILRLADKFKVVRPDLSAPKK